eukprot:COSAG06_NODE_855_length_11931_cov_20.218813_17_plen_67_part_00
MKKAREHSVDVKIVRESVKSARDMLTVGSVPSCAIVASGAIATISKSSGCANLKRFGAQNTHTRTR